MVAEYDNGAAPSAPSREYVYGGAALLAKIDSSGTSYYHQDHLSNRLVTSSTGVILNQMGHYPFGESWYNSTGDKLFFTTYERDAESGNDYAQARYYANRLGRFSSRDPLSGDISDPQSLNPYNYVENDPANLADPSGADPEVVPTCQIMEDLCPYQSIATIILNVWAPYCEPGECGSLDPSYDPGYLNPSIGGGTLTDEGGHGSPIGGGGGSGGGGGFRQILANGLANLSDRCKELLPLIALNSALNYVAFYDARTSGSPDANTVGTDILPGGTTKTLWQATRGGDAAWVMRTTSGQFSMNVIIGPAWNISSPAIQQATLVHEEAHVVTAMDDGQLWGRAQTQGATGNPNLGPSQNFNNWIAGGCQQGATK